MKLNHSVFRMESWLRRNGLMGQLPRRSERSIGHPIFGVVLFCLAIVIAGGCGGGDAPSVDSDEVVDETPAADSSSATPSSAKAADAGVSLPKLTNVDWSGVKPTTLGSSSENSLVDPPVQSEGVKLAAAVVLKSNDDDTHGLAFAAPTTAKVVALSKDSEEVTREELMKLLQDKKIDATEFSKRSMAISKSAELNHRLNSYDLQSGEHLRQIALPDRAWLLDAAPDGSRAAVRLLMGEKDAHITSEQTRIDVWSFSDGRHIAGWEPYADLSGEDAVVTSAVFVEANRIYTINRTGKLILWSLPACKALAMADTGGQGALVRSPGGKYVAVYAGATFRMFDPATNAEVGALAVPSAVGAVRAAAFHPAGTHFAAVIEAPGEVLVTWNLEAGEVESEFPVPLIFDYVRISRRFEDHAEFAPLQWCDDQFLIFQGLVIDRSAQTAVWRIISRGAIAANSFDGQFWYTSGGIMRARQIPDAEIHTLIKSRSPAGAPLILPGTKVTLNVQLTGANAGDGIATAELKQKFVEKLVAAGMTVAANQPVSLNVTASVTKTGKMQEFRKMGASLNDTMSVPVFASKGEVAFTTSAGKVWANAFDREGAFFVSLRGSDSVEEAVRKNSWSTISSHFHNVELPAYVFRSDAVAQLGKTDLSSGSTNARKSTAEIQAEYQRKIDSINQTYQSRVAAAKARLNGAPGTPSGAGLPAGIPLPEKGPPPGSTLPEVATPQLTPTPRTTPKPAATNSGAPADKPASTPAEPQKPLESGEVAALIKALQDPELSVRKVAMQKLAATQDAAAAVAIAERLDKLTDRSTARKALISMGPVAEEAVIAQLKSEAWLVRQNACTILQEIGTRQSWPELKKLWNDPKDTVQNAAKAASEVVRDRK